MGFKLGSERGNYAVGGEIKTKMRFGKKTGGDASVPGTPVIRVPLEEGVMGEANMDGTIYINENITPGSAEERQVVNHEMRHATDMRIGKLEYGDYYVKYNGETFPRETINGKDMIKVEGEWREAGDHDFPWEEDANNGNDNVTV
tara:strand:- start:13 stop:447 length:435 start_codon:yes stop_codon:yes gene_type:complete